MTPSTPWGRPSSEESREWARRGHTDATALSPVVSVAPATPTPQAPKPWVSRRLRRGTGTLLMVVAALGSTGSAMALRDVLFPSTGDATTRSVWQNPGITPTTDTDGSREFPDGNEGSSTTTTTTSSSTTTTTTTSTSEPTDPNPVPTSIGDRGPRATPPTSEPDDDDRGGDRDDDDDDDDDGDDDSGGGRTPTTTAPRSTTTTTTTTTTNPPSTTPSNGTVDDDHDDDGSGGDGGGDDGDSDSRRGRGRGSG